MEVGWGQGGRGCWGPDGMVWGCVGGFGRGWSQPQREELERGSAALHAQNGAASHLEFQGQLEDRGVVRQPAYRSYL